MAEPSLLFLGVLGIAARGLVLVPSIQDIFRRRVEFSVPPNSWRRVLDGLYLKDNGVDPYSGDTFHETPVCLCFFSWIRQFLSTESISLLFPICDIATAILLFAFAQNLVEQLIVVQELKKPTYHKDSVSLLINFDSIKSVPRLVLLLYLCNPFLVGSCLAQTTTTFTNLLLGAMLFSASVSKTLPCRWLSILFLVLASYQTMYMALLFPALHLYLQRVSRPNMTTFSPFSAVLDFAVFVAFSAAILLYSAMFMGSWSFIRGVYGFLITSPDYTPNIGLFWYFFTEMFDQFRSFFVWIFFMNVCIYSIPVSVKLRRDPTFAIFILLPLITVFKPYPSLGEVGFYLSLLPLWSHLVPYMRQKLVIGIMLVIATVLFPVLWKLWIEVGSANANFIYAITLVFVTSQVFLVTDLFIAHEKREWHLKNGMLVLDKQGLPAQLGLQ